MHSSWKALKNKLLINTWDSALIEIVSELKKRGPEIACLPKAQEATSQAYERFKKLMETLRKIVDAALAGLNAIYDVINVIYEVIDTLRQFLVTLEDNEDVQSVYTNLKFVNN